MIYKTPDQDEWLQKQYDWERVWNSGRQCRDISKYIPERLFDQDAIEDYTTNMDGYWLWLTEGWTAYNDVDVIGTIHEYNIADLKATIKTIRRVS